MIARLFMYTICAYAISEMMVFGRGPFGVFEWIRYIAGKISSGMKDLFSCMLCLPMWVGMILSVINIFAIPSIAFVPSLLVYGLPISKGMLVFNIIADGLFTSGICWLIYQIESFVETFVKRDEDEQ